MEDFIKANENNALFKALLEVKPLKEAVFLQKFDLMDCDFHKNSLDLWFLTNTDQVAIELHFVKTNFVKTKEDKNKYQVEVYMENNKTKDLVGPIEFIGITSSLTKQEIYNNLEGFAKALYNHSDLHEADDRISKEQVIDNAYNAYEHAKTRPNAITNN